MGIDIAPEMIKLAEHNCLQRSSDTRVRFESRGGGKPAFETGSVDFVVSSLSLHHWLDPALALAEIFRV